MPGGITKPVDRRSGAANRHSKAVESFVLQYGQSLLRIARSFTSCATDADDAYQRTLEVMLTKAPEGAEGEQLFAWAVAVARNEALMQHRRSKKFVDVPFEEISKSWIDVPDGPDERLIEGEHLMQGREALRRLTADQMRLLLLRADGLSYDEISDQTGFSFAKVNRILTEGRKAFRSHVAKIESGAECSRLEGALSMMADGEAREEAVRDVQLHLENCLACRVTLRESRDAPRKLAELFPVGGLVELGRSHAWSSQILDSLQKFGDGISQRLFGVERFASSSEIMLAKKAAAVVAVSASLVAGGAAVHGLAGTGSGRGSTAVGVRPAEVTAAVGGGRSTDRIRRRRSKSGKFGTAEQPQSSAAAAAERVIADPDRQSAEPLNPSTADDDRGFAADPADLPPVGGGVEGGEGGLAP